MWKKDFTVRFVEKESKKKDVHQNSRKKPTWRVVRSERENPEVKGDVTGSMGEALQKFTKNHRDELQQQE